MAGLIKCWKNIQKSSRIMSLANRTKVVHFVQLKCHIKRYVRGIIVNKSIQHSKFNFVLSLQGNPTIFIESTIHPPEWITVSVATYFLNELVSSNQSHIRYLAENFDWVIVPVFNVDGFVYTHTTVSGTINSFKFISRNEIKHQ